MDLNRVDTERAYTAIREKITALELPPGSSVDPGRLAADLDMGIVPIQEALKLLVHEGLVDLPPDGIYVADVNLPDLRQLSEIRILLEGFAARLAADRASEDDLAVLDALRQEQAKIPGSDARRLFDVDHKFHRAIARAAHNEYLAQALERFYGLSLRLWHLALPDLDVLAGAVEDHLDLLEAIRGGDGEGAEKLIQEHIRGFYDQVHDVLEAEAEGEDQDTERKD